jgi:trimethylamine--corrinoid protein Co-methyltransferase
MMDMALGGEGEFRKRPFCSISCCHVVPPLRFAKESCDALEAAVRSGMPVTLLSAAQAGATGPAALAGTIVQAVAECLAGYVFSWLIDPQCRANLGTWPFVSDLRTGAMSSGSAEQALLSAGCAQMADFYDMPGSVAAGMTDSKVPDAQSGAEKAFTLALTAQAGSTLIMETAGMHASLMGTALESYVIDNDMLGAIQRTVRGIEVTDETLSFEVIRDTVRGEGHFLGSPQTLSRMETDYFYPKVGDRNSPSVWEEGGAKDIRERARARVKEVLCSHYPSHIDPAVDEKIRAAFNISLPRKAMLPGNGRW